MDTDYVCILKRHVLYVPELLSVNGSVNKRCSLPDISDNQRIQLKYSYRLWLRVFTWKGFWRISTTYYEINDNFMEVINDEMYFL